MQDIYGKLINNLMSLKYLNDKIEEENRREQEQNEEEKQPDSGLLQKAGKFMKKIVSQDKPKPK